MVECEDAPAQVNIAIGTEQLLFNVLRSQDR